jgi:hypothetical protein
LPEVSRINESPQKKESNLIAKDYKVTSPRAELKFIIDDAANITEILPLDDLS